MGILTKDTSQGVAVASEKGGEETASPLHYVASWRRYMPVELAANPLAAFFEGMCVAIGKKGKPPSFRFPAIRIPAVRVSLSLRRLQESLASPLRLKNLQLRISDRCYNLAQIKEVLDSDDEWLKQTFRIVGIRICVYVQAVNEDLRDVNTSRTLTLKEIQFLLENLDVYEEGCQLHLAEDEAVLDWNEATE